MQVLSEQELERRKDREELMEARNQSLSSGGFPNSTLTSEDISTYTKTARRIIKGLSRSAGRLMSRRIMGSPSFGGDSRIATEDFQYTFVRDDICPGEDKTLL